MDYGPNIQALTNSVNALQSALNSSISALQKSRDSLSNALSQTNTNLSTTNTNVANLSKSLDSVKTALQGVNSKLSYLSLRIDTANTQIASLNAQLLTSNSNIATINSQINIININIANFTTSINLLNQEYNQLLIQLNYILSQLYSPAFTLLNGLVAYFPFTGNANDSSGNGNNGIVNGATLTSDRFGNSNSAYSFNGQSNYITTLNSPSISITSSITMVAWVYDYGASNNYHTILNKRVNDNWSYGLDYSFNYGPGGSPTEVNKVFSGRRANNSTYLDGYRYSNSTISFNQWQCIVVTIQNNKVSFYINGVDAGTNIYGNTYNISMVDQPVGLTIGSANPGEWMNGKIDDIRIYNRALSQTEISYLAIH
jgi:prefoldin subunit 5